MHFKSDPIHCAYSIQDENCKATYHIAGNFDRGNFDVFDAFQPDRQNLTHQIFEAIHVQCLEKDTDHLSKYFPSNI